MATDDRPGDNKSFCVLPWMHLNVLPDGTASICCVARQPVHNDNAPLSLQAHSLEALWNSPYMRAVRRAMLAGRRVADCSHCYLVERNGGASRRQNANVRWVAELGPRLDALLEESRLHDGALTSLPLYYQLIPGNLCNLKCRMCKPEFSRQIERDPVHRRWAPPGPTPALAGPLARWTNGRVTLVPDTPCDVAVNGFYAPEVVRGRPLVWTGGRAGVTIQVPPGVRPEALRLRVRSYHPRGTRLQVRANGAVAFEGVVPRWSGPLPRRGWEHTLALPDVARDRRLSIELRSSTFRPEGTRDLGIPIDLLELIYSGAPQATPASRLPEGPWYRDDAWIREVLLQNAADLRGLYFTGGEPMIEKQVENILRWLIDRNFAGNVALEMNTNCTIVREPMLEMLRGFRHVVLALSIDACGPVYESIRFPAKWAAVAQNAQRLAAMAGPRFQPMGGIALQVFNLLHLVEVAEFFDGLGLPFHVELVTSPSFLAIGALPQSVRDIAVRRLKMYAQGRCAPERRAHVLSVARQIEAVKNQCTLEQLRTLMLFTNDLDFSRRQNVRDVHGELLSLLQAEGFTWTDERSIASAA